MSSSIPISPATSSLLTTATLRRSRIRSRRYDPAMRLVLLHALPFDKRMWETTQPLLYDAFAPTLYGLGNSLQEWAVAVLDHCEGEELIVVGSSVGGSCALEIARASPDQVRGIVLVGAKASVRRDPVAREVIVRALQDDGIHAAWARYWAPLFSSTADAETLAAARRLALEQDVDDLIRGVRALPDRRDQAEFVSAWAGHLVVVSGARDRTPTPAAAAASVAGGRYEHVVVEDCGHYVPLERPDMFYAVLTDQISHMQQA